MALSLFKPLPSEAQPTRRQTLCVLGLAATLRLLVIGAALLRQPPRWFFTRGIEMGLLADSLLRGVGLSSPFGGATGPTAFIAPAYPLLVAGVFRLFGTYSLFSAAVLMLLQTAANLLTVWLVMQLASTLFRRRAAALLAGCVWAAGIPLLWMPTIFWDTCFAVAALTSLLFAALRLRAPVPGWVWAALGAGSALLGLLNPAMLPTSAAILLWLAWQHRPGILPRIALAVLSFLLVFSPWPIRNARVFHSFVPLRTTVGFELWMGNRPGTSGFLEEALFPMYNREELDSYQRLGEIAYTDGKSAAARSYIAAHPLTFARLTLLRIGRFWSGTGNRKGSPVFALHACLTSAFGFAGLFLLLRRQRFADALLLGLPLLLFPLPYYITHAEFRYRLAVDPILVVLAAGACLELGKQSDSESATTDPQVALATP